MDNEMDRPSQYRRTMRLNQRDLADEIEREPRITEEVETREQMENKLNKIEEAIWLIDKKHDRLIEQKWQEYYRLKKILRSATDKN